MIQKTCLVISAAFLAYLAGDLFVFNGPARRGLERFSPDSPASVEKAKAEGVVARVGDYPITSSQVDRAVTERLWWEGRKPADLQPEDLAAARRAALQDLIDRHLIRSGIAGLEKPIEVPAAEIDARFQELVAPFGGKEALGEALASQGISSEKELRDRVAARLREEKFILAAVPAVVTEGEAEKWYAEHQQDLGLPERLEARHIFAATLDTPPDQAKQKLEGALAALSAKQKDFAALAKELSEDPATKDSGGNLGWMSRRRLSPDFAEPVFSLGVNQPSLIRSRLGWHLVEVTGRKSAEPRAFQDAKPEVLAALEAVKRRDALASYRGKLRADAAAGIRIYDEALR